MSALSLAAIAPGLLLQGVATRSRETDTADPATAGPADDPAAPDQGEPQPDRQSASETLVVAVDQPAAGDSGGDFATDSSADGRAALLAAATANAEAAAKPAADEAGEAGSDKPNRPHRVRANRGARRPRATEAADENSDSSRPESDQPASAVTLPGEPAEADEAAALDATSGEPANSDEAASKAKSKQDRQSARLRQRQEVKAEQREQVKAAAGLPAITYEEGQAAHAAMVRHIGALTASLAEAHRIIGRLNLEKYQAQKDLAIAKKLPLPPPPPDPSWTRAPRPGEPRVVRQLQRNKQQDEDEYDPEVLAHAKAVGRRRQFMFVAAMAVIGLCVFGYNLAGWSWFPDITNRDALTQIAGFGVFVQLFFIGWMMYRFARIGGKGARWLFPNAEEEQRKLRRKQR